MALLDDRFRNILAVEVVMSAANVETFVEVVTGVSIGQGLGMVIDAIDYYPSSGTLRELAASTDVLHMAISTSDQITDFTDVSDRRLIDVVSLIGHAVGTPANTIVHEVPKHREFTPPMIVANPRMYAAVDSVGSAAVGTVRFRMAYRFIKLSTQEYLEIAETFILTG